MRKYTVFFVLCWILLGCMTIPGFAKIISNLA